MYCYNTCILFSYCHCSLIIICSLSGRADAWAGGAGEGSLVRSDSGAPALRSARGLRSGGEAGLWAFRLG